jgi:hypothetical protein
MWIFPMHRFDRLQAWLALMGFLIAFAWMLGLARVPAHEERLTQKGPAESLPPGHLVSLDDGGA